MDLLVVALLIPTQQRADSYVHRAAERRPFRKLGFRLCSFLGNSEGMRRAGAISDPALAIRLEPLV
jgi:hypothetical protein